jgi:spore coat protein CotH
MKHPTIKSAAAMIACAGLLASAFAQIPTIKITTQNSQVPPYAAGTACPVSGGGSCTNYMDPACWGGGGWGWGGNSESIAPKLDYVRMTNFEISGAGARNKTISGEPDSVRRRGNSTANTNKIPFRVKFDKRQELFGDTSKSWAFLANYYDATFMLNAIAFELGKRVNLEFTPKYQFVKLEMNGQDRGVYLMTPQISGNKYSVNIDRDFGGWLVEFDYHSPNDQDCNRSFTTARYDIKTKIRYPEWGDDVTDSADYRYRALKNDINNLVNKMQENGFPNNGYRDLIDLESWAKYVLVQLFMDNFDFNSKAQTGYLLGSNYLYRIDDGSKIKAGPLWDFDLAAGVTMNNFPAHYNNYTDMTRPTHQFYTRLWADTLGFLTQYKKAWNDYKRHFEDISKSNGFIDSLTNLLASSAQGNIYGSGNMGMNAGTLTEQTFRSEVTKLKTWWNNRLNHFGQQVDAMNIPAPPSTSADARAKSMNGKNIAAVQNGLNLKVSNRATVKVFGLDGREVRNIKLSNGNHAVRFGDLPRGMYMVNVVVDGNRQVLRTMVR